MIEFETEIETQDGILDAFVCHPDEGGPHPAVILYMDAPGIREELRDMTRRIAATGYVAMLPNLYYRIGREGNYGYDLSNTANIDAERARMFDCMNSLTNARIVADTGPMVAFLRGKEAVSDGPMGCVGYCMSGKFVTAVAAAYPDEFAAIASYYGVGIVTEEADSPHLDLDKIKGEIYFAFASDDPWVPQTVLDQLPGALDAAGTNHRIEIYPGTGHGFAFPNRPDYVKPAAERHWQRMLALFDRNLRQ